MTSASPTSALRATGAEHNSRACKSARHTRVQYVVAADERSLSDLETLLATLPLCATGRVFIEAPDEAAIVTFAAPARMTVSWLARSRRGGRPGTGAVCRRGEALARAVIAWSDEMLCSEPGEHDHTRAYLLSDYVATADMYEHLVDVRGVQADAVVTPERFGLSRSR